MSKDICVKAVRTFGNENQLDIAQEECAEVIQAISKYKRNINTSKRCECLIHLLEEIADVEIMIEQLKIITSQELYKINNEMWLRCKGTDNIIKNIKQSKIDRLKQTIKDYKKKGE